MGANTTCAMCSSLLLVMARIQRCLPGAMCRLQLTAQPLRRAGLETRGNDMDGYEIAFLMLVLTVAGGVAGVVGCLIERYLVTPIMSRWKPRGWL